jgi:membrane protein insertase Oxa1/YidC/SpoIIIJ
MLANFSAGLVIYWAWNNTLSVTQQSIIMRRNGVKVELWDNISSSFSKLGALPGRLKTLGSNLPQIGEASANWLKELLAKIKPPKL